MNRLDRMHVLVRTYVPDLRMVEKKDSQLMRGLGILLRPVSPDFETHFTVVIGRTVYLAKPIADWQPDRLAATLAHELIHQLDQQRWGLGFYLSYFLCLPTGRTMRAWWERRAYVVDLLLARERGGPPGVERTLNWLVEIFAGPNYGWMWAGQSAARRFLEPVARDVLAGRYDEVEPYCSILAAWREPAGYLEVVED